MPDKKTMISKAWATDGDTILLNDEWKNISLVKNSLVEEFLDVGPHDKKFFIVAPKGCGKTLLLKKKSQSYREKGKASVFLPKKSLCERVTSENAVFSEDDIRNFSDQSLWVDLWNIALSIYILKNMNIDLPKDAADLVGNNHKLSHIMSVLLQDRTAFKNNVKILLDDLNYRISEVQEDVAVFVDGVDEAFEKHNGFATIQSKDRVVESENIWANAQIGFLESARTFHFTNSKIKIFASIRKEVFLKVHTATALQLKNYCTLLEYTFYDLKEIFEKNIQMMFNTEVLLPEEDDVYVRFLGYNKVPHEYVPNRSEDVFEYILRHTFARPREIVTMGYNLYHKYVNPLKRKCGRIDIETLSTIDEKDTIKALRKVTNDTASELFSQYKKEFTPYFDDDLFESFAKKVKSNVVSSSQANTIIKSLSDHMPNIFNYYYNCGMIGVVEQHYNDVHNLTQHFNTSQQAVVRDSNVMPNVSTYVIHPAVNLSIVAVHDPSEYTYYKVSVIGYDYSFIKGKKPSINLHLHFGAGLLGMGFVVPTLVSTTNSLTIVQRPSVKWQELIEKSRECNFSVQLQLNETVVGLRLFVISDETNEVTRERCYQDWKIGKINILLLTADIKKIKPFMEATHTISTSVKDGLMEIGECLNCISVENSQKKILMPFENDLTKVKQMEKMLGPGIEVAYVTVDKICKEMDISIQKITIACEDDFDGEAIIDTSKLTRDNKTHLSRMLRNKRNIKRTKKETEFDFYHNKKLYFVNSVHAVIASIGYYIVDTHTKITEEQLTIDLIIQHTSFAPMIKAFNNMVIYMLIKNHLRIVERIYDKRDVQYIFKSLKKESKMHQERFIDSQDAVSRILKKSDIKAKYSSRIKGVIDFVLGNEEWIYTTFNFKESDKEEMKKHILEFRGILLEVI